MPEMDEYTAVKLTSHIISRFDPNEVYTGAEVIRQSRMGLRTYFSKYKEGTALPKTPEPSSPFEIQPREEINKRYEKKAQFLNARGVTHHAGG